MLGRQEPFLYRTPGHELLSGFHSHHFRLELGVRAVRQDDGDIKFKSKVIRVESGKEVLTKGAIKKGLLTSEHSFLIETIEDNKCVFSQRIKFTGLMTLFAGKVIKDSQVALNKMNEELKKRCEKK